MNVGAVVIGRNEGERLRRCLESVKEIAEQVVYVDSGSTDGSVPMTLGMGLEVVELDLSIPFTAARARNEGFRRLLKLAPNLAYVQFVDGDCEIVNEWLEVAAKFLDKHDDIAMVCGRLRERHPEQSIYNMLCDIEWDTEVGMSMACGGNAMVRLSAFRSEGGYCSGMIAGEEPELCVRLRAAGWRIWRLDAEMALHDAAMTSFWQWWRRSVRGGFAFAEGAYMHGAPPERHWVRETRSALVWGGLIPLGIIVIVLELGVWGLVLLVIYPIQLVRLTFHGRRSARENWWRAFFLVLGKFPEMLGCLKYYLNRFSNRKSTLIEYK